MEKFIKFTIKQLKIYDLSSFCRKWEEVLDWFFYFNKATGCGVPSFEDVRRYL